MPELVSSVKTEFTDRDRALAQIAEWAEKSTRWPVVVFSPEGCGKTAFLRLELERLKALAKTEEERRWLGSKAVPRVPTTKMKELSRLLRDVGHEGITFVTDKALDLHDYQYHGPDPDMALSKYAARQSAAADVVELLQELTRRIEALRSRVKWGEELEKALEEVKRVLTP